MFGIRHKHTGAFLYADPATPLYPYYPRYGWHTNLRPAIFDEKDFSKLDEIISRTRIDDLEFYELTQEQEADCLIGRLQGAM